MEKTNSNDDISLKEIIVSIKHWLRFLILQWWKILIVALLGGSIGYIYAKYQPINYSAKLSLLVEDGKASSSGGLASIAGQFGIDVNSGNGSGLLSGENLLLFLKSTSLTKEVLLSNFDSTKKYSLADKYADVYGLRDQWKTNKLIGNVFFPVQAQSYSRLQDSLMQQMVFTIVKNGLIVLRPEKKASFVTIEAKMQDELLAKLYCEKLVEKAVDRYVQSKTKKQRANVDKLQSRADSITRVLNNKTYANAYDQERILDINPSARTATVNAELSSRDKGMLMAIYGEVIKNLEISKFQLSQETPTIQIIDGVETPLKKTKASKLIYLIVGGMVAVFLTIAFYTSKLIVKRFK